MPQVFEAGNARPRVGCRRRRRTDDSAGDTGVRSGRRVDVDAIANVQGLILADAEALERHLKAARIGLETLDVGILCTHKDMAKTADPHRLELRLGRIVGEHREPQATLDRGR